MFWIAGPPPRRSQAGNARYWQAPCPPFFERSQLIVETHAEPLQSPLPLHPHAPWEPTTTQAWPGLHSPLQSTQDSPVSPHAVFDAPGVQFVPSQHPPLHFTLPPAQDVSQIPPAPHA